MDDIYQEDFLVVKKTKRGIRQFVNISFILLIAILLTRLLEMVMVIKGFQSPHNFLQVFFKALLLDLLWFLKISFILFLPFIITVNVVVGEKKIQVIQYGVLSTIVLIVGLLLTKYYITTLVPLGADLFGYSFTEIKQTALAGASVDLVSVILFLLIIVFLWLGILFTSSKNLFPLNIGIAFIVLCGLAALSGLSFVPAPVNFKSDFDYNMTLNKSGYFFEKSFVYFNESEPEVDIYAENYIDDFSTDANGSNTIRSFKYTDPKYPFLRQNDAEDVLGNFFNKFNNPPNIVYIQVEGLGRAFSGQGAYLESFTPFLDMLAAKSLYFENFLASQGRTFASLPSVLGSLPFAEHGFSDLGTAMPKHLSLLNILRANGYSTRFFSGFDLDFDNEGIFLNKSGIQQTISLHNFGNQYKKMPANSGGFTWGYGDMELMHRAAGFDANGGGKPDFNFIQTVSMHTPYKVNDQILYEEAFEKTLNRLGFDDRKKQEYRQYKNVYSTILYTDAALAEYFRIYAKRSDFSNTIFLISGDHRLPEIPMSTKIDRYHVPLIIYSPMLKRSARIRSVSSHFDIAPSLLAFLHKNYGLKTPSQVNFVGSGLDTVRNFRNVHKYPLMQTKNELSDYVSGEYFLNQDILFNINNKMDIETVADESIKSQLKSELKQFKIRNNAVAKVKSLVPDSLYKKYAF